LSRHPEPPHPHQDTPPHLQPQDTLAPPPRTQAAELTAHPRPHTRHLASIVRACACPGAVPGHSCPWPHQQPPLHPSARAAEVAEEARPTQREYSLMVCVFVCEFSLMVAAAGARWTRIHEHHSMHQIASAPAPIPHLRSLLPGASAPALHVCVRPNFPSVAVVDVLKAKTKVCPGAYARPPWPRGRRGLGFRVTCV
jgi:hypothetical protein